MRFLFVAMALAATGSAACADPDYYHLPGSRPVLAEVPQQPMDSEVAALKARIESLEKRLAETEKKVNGQDAKLDAILAALVEKKAAPPKPVPRKEPIRYTPLLLDGAKQFTGDGLTQKIFAFTGGADVIEQVRVRDMPDKRWNQPGGMLDVTGWKVEKFKYIPEGESVKTWVDNITVENSTPDGYDSQLGRWIRPPKYKSDGTYVNYTQQNRGIIRSYPVGTRFDEVLMNATTGLVFEHRVREKKASGWKSHVEFADEEARPAGYTGLTVSCSSCHSQTGSGGYSAGLVPGGDTIFGDSLDWSLVYSDGRPKGVRLSR